MICTGMLNYTEYDLLKVVQVFSCKHNRMENKMKKRIVAIMISIMAVSAFAGCGADAKPQAESSQEVQVQASNGLPNLVNVPLKDLDVDNYVTLPDYKNIQVEVPAASEEEIDAQLWETYLYMFPQELGVTDREVQMKDTANIDYVGKKDGEAFQGGTASGYNLTIGSHSFIDGFEDGLVGVMPGETVDLNLTFPEDYGNSELAGQEVVFTVTVNYIIPEKMLDEVFANSGIPGATDVASTRKLIEDTLNQELATQAENSVLEAVLEQCVFENIPSMMVENYKANVKASIESNAAMYNMDGEQFATTYYGTDLETLAQSYGENSLKMNLACQAIANRENLNVSDDMLKDQIAAAAATAGVSVEEYLGTSTEEEFREYLMYMNVLQYLADVNLNGNK